MADSIPLMSPLLPRNLLVTLVIHPIMVLLLRPTFPQLVPILYPLRTLLPQYMSHKTLPTPHPIRPTPRRSLNLNLNLNLHHNLNHNPKVNLSYNHKRNLILATNLLGPQTQLLSIPGRIAV